MPAFYRASLSDFAVASDSELLGRLSLAYARVGYEHLRAEQMLTWSRDLPLLRRALAEVLEREPSAKSWALLLEFDIPRKMRRIDAVLIAGDQIVPLELKTHLPTAEDRLQAEEYALLLHYFHEPSSRRFITPLVVSERAASWPPKTQQELPFTETAAYWIAPVRTVAWANLAEVLLTLRIGEWDAIDAGKWEAGAYQPVPTIIQAALSLQAGLDIREIAHSGAARHEVDQLTAVIQAKVAEARQLHQHVICFVTGVPGSGKTLVGLNLAFSKVSEAEPIHFMSGNGPLVKVLQAVLARHQMGRGIRALDAKMHAKTLIENVHVFARTYTDDDKLGAPSNHVVIFDEAQRAWDRAQNLAKFKRDYSEPEMLLRIMERHQDWAVVVALVGGGQEINSGEAGLAEWGRSLARTVSKPWKVYASIEAMTGGSSVAGTRLDSDAAGLDVAAEAALHLDVSVRSLKAATYAAWVNAVVDGDAARASALRKDLEFPVLLTRQLAQARALLRSQTLGWSRSGLVGSSQAARLRAEGLEPDSAFHGGYPWEHWYLAEPADVRSSYQHEVFATEFEIQGLELDWVGVCWGGDYVWSANRQEWVIRAFRAGSSKWSEIKSPARRGFRRNAYRVLLTRARQGVMLYVPAGEEADATRQPREFDETAAFLLQCGARIMDDAEPAAGHPKTVQAGLFG